MRKILLLIILVACIVQTIISLYKGNDDAVSGWFVSIFLDVYCLCEDRPKKKEKEVEVTFQIVNNEDSEKQDFLDSDDDDVMMDEK